ncbi:MAG: hypothetical protein Q4C54_10490 [Clostridia bacterium]|nr:hypothetical protein [Clostridia bacterium]
MIKKAFTLRILSLLPVLLLVLSLAFPALGEAYTFSGPVTILCPAPFGSREDMVLRALQPLLAEELDTPVMVENIDDVPEALADDDCTFLFSANLDESSLPYRLTAPVARPIVYLAATTDSMNASGFTDWASWMAWGQAHPMAIDVIVPPASRAASVPHSLQAWLLFTDVPA